jgi:hypothetical protein
LIRITNNDDIRTANANLQTWLIPGRKSVWRARRNV